jgi:hypothetical protein
LCDSDSYAYSKCHRGQRALQAAVMPMVDVHCASGSTSSSSSAPSTSTSTSAFASVSVSVSSSLLETEVYFSGPRRVTVAHTGRTEVHHMSMCHARSAVVANSA